VKYATTLEKLRAKSACPDRYIHLLAALGKGWPDDKLIPLVKILETNGLDDAIWALGAVDGIEKETRLFAYDIAEHVLPIYEEKHPDDKRPRGAIKSARHLLEGEVSADDMVPIGGARVATWATWAAIAASDADLAAATDKQAVLAALFALVAERSWQADLFVKYFK